MTAPESAAILKTAIASEWTCTVYASVWRVSTTQDSDIELIPAKLTCPLASVVVKGRSQKFRVKLCCADENEGVFARVKPAP